MKTISLNITRQSAGTIALDLVALAIVYFAPAFAHLASLPVYMIEPMRLMLILSAVHTNRKNTLLLALTLPLFSYIVSAHPAFIKMLIITGEMVLNTVLFFFLAGRLKNLFSSMFFSILLSKVFCYLMYLLLFPIGFFIAEAEPFFLGIQLLTATLFSLYVFVFYKK